MRKALHALYLAPLLIAAALHGQSKPAAAGAKLSDPPPFDIVSIHPNRSGLGNMGWNTTSSGYSGDNMTLLLLISNAYDIRTDLISGQPGWVTDQHFNLQAKLVDQPSVDLDKFTDEQRNGMLRAVLADRFHLKAHIEAKTLPVYDLAIAKSGSKLKAVPPPGDTDDPGRGGWSSGNDSFKGQAIAIDSFTRFLAAHLERTVIDKTDLKSRYDIALHWTPDNTPTSSDSTFPTIFKAIEEQLGLRLESSKGPVDTLVIDHVEQPTEN